MEHELELVPQPTADGWQAKCSCGKWKTFASFYEYRTKDDLIAELSRQHSSHITPIQPS